MALAVGSDKKIIVAVVVVVTDRYAHSKHFDVEPSFVGHVGERAVMIVVIELGRGVLFKVAGPLHAVHKKNARTAVVVVVNEGHPGPPRFGQKFFSSTAVTVN